MKGTRATLLVRVRDREDEAAWSQFHDLYAPLLYAYARHRGLRPVDAEEIRDQCLLAVTSKIGAFDYDSEKGGFRSWLYRIANGKVIDFLRKRREKAADTHAMQSVPDPSPSPEELWDRQWRHQHILYCASLVKQDVAAQTYRVFEMLAFDERDVDDVCRELGITRNQAYIAKSRVLRRIREEIERLGVSL